MAHAMTEALKAGPNSAGPRRTVDTGIATAPTTITAGAESNATPEVMAGDASHRAIPGLERIAKG